MKEQGQAAVESEEVCRTGAYATCGGPGDASEACTFAGRARASALEMRGVGCRLPELSLSRAHE